MTSRFGLPCLSTRLGVTSRSLGLLFLCLSLLLLVAPPVASQDGDAGGGGVEPPYVEPQPREWATLDITVNTRDSLSDEVGRQSAIPVTITNNGNITAVGTVAVIEGGNLLAGTPVKVGDLPPEVQSSTGAAPVATGADWHQALDQALAEALAGGERGAGNRLEKEFERVLIKRALLHTTGRRIEAATWLGWGRNTLTRKIQEQGLDDEV